MRRRCVDLILVFEVNWRSNITVPKISFVIEIRKTIDYEVISDEIDLVTLPLKIFDKFVTIRQSAKLGIVFHR